MFLLFPQKQIGSGFQIISKSFSQIKILFHLLIGFGFQFAATEYIVRTEQTVLQESKLYVSILLVKENKKHLCALLNLHNLTQSTDVFCQHLSVLKIEDYKEIDNKFSNAISF